MQTHVHSGALFGIDALLVDVEVDIIRKASRSGLHCVSSRPTVSDAHVVSCRWAREAPSAINAVASASTSTSGASMPK